MRDTVSAVPLTREACALQLREVQEETGIEATFERVVAFRHWHGAMFGKSDLFFVCLLRARSAPPHACSRCSR